ncbi:MAG: hypothetical protein Ct9H300mP7_5840 [Verrucomicrobiota bacterium]|nr:MAG: hypothetical protein Ct9H300mP7_5840 [Verrucomicrobiota bacterium]
MPLLPRRRPGTGLNGHNEQTFADHLYTAGTPDPDLLIRTSGEMRISNFLLWQISYAELVVTEQFWPDFGRRSSAPHLSYLPAATGVSEKFDPDQAD